MADTLGGSVERVVYSNPENGYTVLRLSPSSEVPAGVLRGGLVTVIGTFPEISGGEKLVLQGTWVTHSTHGTQFQADEFQQQIPTTVAGIQRYLGSGLIKGIGERLAERIVDHFGADTINIIESQPDRLLEVSDIGVKRAQMITEAWEEQKNIKQIMLFLHSQRISTSLAVKIYKHYGNGALQVVRNDPYRLATDIRGIGFKTADQVARKIGLPADHPSRIEAGVLYALDQSSNEGNVFYPQDLLVDSALQLLNVPENHIQPAIQRLINQEHIHLEMVPTSAQQMYLGTDRFSERAEPIDSSFPERDRQAQVLYPIQLYYSELGTARNLAALSSAFPTRLSDVPPGFVSLDPALSDEQKDAVKSSLSNPVSVLTGGPGTGKTTTIRALISALQAAGKTFALASPTGRAAKRLSQATGQPASTIHRLLSYSPGEGFRNNATNPLDLDMLVVDEVSMLDILLANHLLKALKPGTHLLLVGDSDQLPSVGPGDVLRDIIASGIAKVNRLTKIFRQAADSHIITNAHRINAGQLPVFPSKKQAGDQQPVDFFLFPSEFRPRRVCAHDYFWFCWQRAKPARFPQGGLGDLLSPQEAPLCFRHHDPKRPPPFL